MRAGRAGASEGALVRAVPAAANVPPHSIRMACMSFLFASSRKSQRVAPGATVALCPTLSGRASAPAPVSSTNAGLRPSTLTTTLSSSAVLRRTCSRESRGSGGVTSLRPIDTPVLGIFTLTPLATSVARAGMWE